MTIKYYLLFIVSDYLLRPPVRVGVCLSDSPHTFYGVWDVDEEGKPVPSLSRESRIGTTI